VDASRASDPGADARASTARLAAAALVAACAFLLYHATLLPSFDFGDTGSFQVTVGSPVITPRDGYPLYFAIGRVILHATHAEPARALNLASAVEAAIASGVIVVVAAELAGSVVAGAGAALLFVVSYTFWSQAIIAEVYGLHILFVAVTLLLLLRWQARPTTHRLTLFFIVYALGFGNHLSMILLLPAYALFILTAAPGGWRSVVRPRVIAIAVACACVGALQYAWNLRALWLTPQPPHGIGEALQHFWFDVTKSDWRDTMVMNVPRSMLSDHAAMYWFDLRQQFGPVIPGIAAVGLIALARRNRSRFVLVALVYLANFLFAFSYNVGDTHVFYLPSHLAVALLAACGAAFLGRFVPRAAWLGGLAIAAYACVRGYDDFPALDRTNDWRPMQVVSELTAGLDDRRAVLLADVNWQVQNGLSYFAKVTRPEVAWARMPDVLLYAPALVADNRAIGREVVLTERARASVAAAYGPLLPAVVDTRVTVPTLADATKDLAAGTRYVMCVLRPSRDLPIAVDDLAEATRALTGGRLLSLLASSEYAAVAGIVGDPPRYLAAGAVPFQRRIDLDGVPVQIRMDSWLSADTIRRMGFGHVIAARHHTLIVERGVSFVAFDDHGVPIRSAYASNIFAPQQRYVIR